MAEASEETDKMEMDGQDQANGADEQKQDEESTPTPIQEVLLFAVYFWLEFRMCYQMAAIAVSYRLV